MKGELLLPYGIGTVIWFLWCLGQWSDERADMALGFEGCNPALWARLVLASPLWPLAALAGLLYGIAVLVRDAIGGE